MFFKIKHFFKYFYIIFFLFISIGCQFQEPSKNHGILFLKNRSDKLTINRSNKNDTLKIIGNPHSKSINNENEWIYFERILTKGEYHKLGRNVLKENNILVLNFDKYGILKNKIFLDKENLKKMAFSSEITENDLTQKSFIQNFLQSLKSKMYSNK